MMLINSLLQFTLHYCIILVTLKSTVDSIVVPELAIKRIENPINRQLIDVSKKVFNSNNKNLHVTIIPCIKNFIINYMKDQPVRITAVFTKKTNQDSVSLVYLTELQKIRSTYVLSEDSNISGEQHTSLNVVIILENFEDLENSTVKFNQLCGRECRYTVLLTNLFPDKKSFIEDSGRLNQLMWIRKTSNIVILGLVKGVLIAAESRAFKPKILRTPMNPIIGGNCKEGEWKVTNKFYQPMRLNKCIINIAFFDNEPYVHAIKQNNRSTIVGLEGLIIRAIIKSLNVVVKPFEIKVQNDTSTQDEIERTFRSNRSIDLVIGGIVWQPSDAVDFTQSYEVLQVVWLIPIEINISLQGLVAPLELNVWLAVGVVLLFSIFLRLFLFKKMSFLEIFAIVMGIVWDRQPKRLSYRIKFMSWIIFGYILSQFYLASLAGRLMAPSGYQIDTMADLVDSDKIIGGLQNHKNLFHGVEEIDDELSTETFDTILKRFITFDYDIYKTKLSDLFSGKNKTLALVAMLNASSINTTFDHSIVHKMREQVTYYPVGFPAWRGLPYLNQIDKKIGQLIQGGIISYMGQRSSPKNHFSQKDEEEEAYIENNYIRFRDIVPGFFILIFGSIIGIFILICEIIFFKLNKKNKAKKAWKLIKINTIKNKLKTIEIDKKKKLLIKRGKILRQNFLKQN